jgi:hypothetical protein
MLKLLVWLLVWLLLLLPVALVVTLMLMPLWSWLEATLNLELVGHSGPASGCYLLTYVLLLALVWLSSGLRCRRR